MKMGFSVVLGLKREAFLIKILFTFFDNKQDGTFCLILFSSGWKNIRQKIKERIISPSHRSL
jgi:hypothetical protein